VADQETNWKMAIKMVECLYAVTSTVSLKPQKIIFLSSHGPYESWVHKICLRSMDCQQIATV